MNAAQMFAEKVSELGSMVTRDLNDEITASAAMIADAINDGHPVFVAGNGGSAADAQHFAAELTVRMQKERRSFPCIVLGSSYASITAACNDYGPESIFSRELSGYHNGVLVVFSTSMLSKNIIHAIRQAKFNGIKVIAFTSGIETETNVQYIHARCESKQCVQEAHGMLLHILVDKVEAQT